MASTDDGLPSAPVVATRPSSGVASARRAAQVVGPVASNEMYGYEPALALALGGSGKPETVRRLDLFAHHVLLSRLTPLKVRPV